MVFTTTDRSNAVALVAFVLCVALCLLTAGLCFVFCLLSFCSISWSGSFFLFELYVAVKNLSIISRRCLDAAGSSMLKFRELPHWNITTRTLHMIFHPVTLSWHRVDQFWVLALLSQCWAPSERAASTIFKVFGMTRSGIEPAISRSQNRRSTNYITIMPVREDSYFVFLWSVSCVLSVIVCLFFLLVSLVGCVQRLWLKLDIFFTKTGKMS